MGVWECKVCRISVISRYELLKHCKLKHGHHGNRFRHPCPYSDCPCTFILWNSLLSHIYRSHQTQASSKTSESSTFSCQLCACHEISNERDYFSHVNEHLRRHETVTCMFKGCVFKTNVYNTFQTHRNRKHNPHTSNDFKPEVVSVNPGLQESVVDVAPCAADTDVESETDFAAHSFSSIEDISHVVEENIASVLLKLEHILSTSEIRDRDTLKVIYFPREETSSSIPETLPSCSTSTPITSPSTSHSSEIPGSLSANILNSPSLDQVDLSSEHSFGSADTIILDPIPESRTSTWPPIFFVPRFSYLAEIQLQTANAEFRANGTLLIPPPKLRMDILEGMAEEIFKYTAYPTDSQIEEAAEVLVLTHPCLKQKGTCAGHEGWKQYLKTKVANFRTKLCKIGLPEVSVNSLKNKRRGQDKAAANIKKPRKAEVNFLPSLPGGETRESLEDERVALLTEVKKRNNNAVIREKMQRTFSYRRQEVVHNEPVISEFVNRWPALFTVSEINAEFMRITTSPLQAKFFRQLDQYTANLIKIFSSRGGAAGKKIRLLMAPIAKTDNIEVQRDCVIRGLCVYLNEDSNTLVKEYLSVNSEDTKREIAQTTMGIYVIRQEGADEEDEPEAVGVVIEGVELLSKLRSITFGFAMLFGLIYTLNLSYPQELKYTFEFFQKVLMTLDGNKLSPKVQTLKIKMLQ